MPYATNDDLPYSVKRSVNSAAGRDIMRGVINSQLEVGKSEAVAFASAWAALQRAGYEQNDDGDWIEVDADKSLTLSDVHVPTTEERGILRKLAEWIIKASEPDTKAPEKDRIIGSERNKPGSAEGERGGIDFDAKTISALEEKAESSQYTLGQLKAVYRRGAGAYSTSHRPGVSRATWAMARVNSFLSGGHPQDNDLKKQDWIEKSDFDDVDLYDQVDLDVFALKAEDIEKAEYQGKEVELNKPFRTPDENKKFAVYVLNDKKNVTIVRFGDSNMEIKRDDPDSRSNFRARHNCETATDKTSPRYWSCRMWSDDSVSEILNKSESFTLTADILKSDEDQRLVYGWASIILENGEPVTDSQGDIISESDLIKAAHNYISQYREAKEMHSGGQIGEVVESLVFTKDVQDALGISLGKIGWFIGVKINDQDLFNKFKTGEYSMFSIGGRGHRIEIEN